MVVFSIYDSEADLMKSQQYGFLNEILKMATLIDVSVWMVDFSEGSTFRWRSTDN